MRGIRSPLSPCCCEGKVLAMQWGCRFADIGSSPNQETADSQGCSAPSDPARSGLRRAAD